MSRASLRVEQDELRARMRAVGMSHDEIAIEFARRYKLRPRAAHRVAHGWTQMQAANHINTHAARAGLDPQGSAPMTAPRLSELENWPLPNNRRRPTPQLLALLAEVYDTSIHNLIDLDDREQMPPADLLLITTIRAKGVPAGTVSSLTRARPAGSEVTPVVEAPNRQQFLLAASALGVAAVLLPRQPAAPAASVSIQPAAMSAADDLLADLREAITVPAEWSAAPDPASSDGLTDLDARARECHSRYQRADYAGAARVLPTVVRGIETLVTDRPAGVNYRRVRRTQAVVYLAVAKLATRTGDQDLAWLAADRGAARGACRRSSGASGDCAPADRVCLLRHGTADAERVAVSALDALNRRPGDEDHPDLLSARGALLLLAAMTSVRQGERTEARRRLAAAAEQAGALGRDDNRLWSAFGPTNVALHTLTAALALDDPTKAVDVGAQIDTRLLPAPLVGRRARLHVDLADGHTRLGEDAVAAVHILDVARRAPQLLRVDPTARAVLATLLGRAHGSTVSVLRSVAEQAGVAT